VNNIYGDKEKSIRVTKNHGLKAPLITKRKHQNVHDFFTRVGDAKKSRYLSEICNSNLKDFKVFFSLILLNLCKFLKSFLVG
jgi:hypothetical protein